MRRRRTPEEVADRLPPGQYAESGWPVLTAGPTPDISTDEWSFRIDGMVSEPKQWTWEEFHTLPFETVTKDIHCVTKWSKQIGRASCRERGERDGAAECR